MQNSRGLDETDLALVHALQIKPRASWALVGEALGINPVTAARRWERLRSDRLAWVASYPGPGLAPRYVVAFVEVDCEPPARNDIVATLARDPRIATIEVIAGGRDLFLTVFAADLPSLSRLTLDELSHLDGVRGTRTQLGTGIYAHGAGWRLDALSPAQQQMISAETTPPVGVPTPADSDRAMLVALGSDGRQSATELAGLTVTSPSTARRRLDRIMRHRLIAFRCEVANVISGWPVIAHFWAKSPPRDTEHVVRSLATVPEVRLCATVTGESNLLITVWLRSLGDSQRIESELARQFPELTLHDRAVSLRIAKRMGWLLDDSGRALDVIPADPWHNPATP